MAHNYVLVSRQASKCPALANLIASKHLPKHLQFSRDHQTPLIANDFIRVFYHGELTKPNNYLVNKT